MVRNKKALGVVIGSMAGKIRAGLAKVGGWFRKRPIPVEKGKEEKKPVAPVLPSEPSQQQVSRWQVEGALANEKFIAACDKIHIEPKKRGTFVAGLLKKYPGASEDGYVRALATVRKKLPDVGEDDPRVHRLAGQLAVEIAFGKELKALEARRVAAAAAAAAKKSEQK
jgi:hypothetical protein